MPTHDYIIANGTGAAVRADINLALSAIVSLNSSASEPGTMYAYQLWADTAAGLLKIRNGANSAWITLRQLDGDFSIVAVEDGLQATPSLTFTNDLNTGVFRSGTDALAIVTGGQYAITCTSTQAVGIRTPNPSTALHVAGNARVGADDVTDAVLEIGVGATGNRAAYIDIVADTTYADYGLRVIRNNTGANATSELKHRGTGALNFTTQEAAPIVFNTTNSPALTITSGGLVGIGTSSPGQNITVQSSANGTAPTFKLQNPVDSNSSEGAANNLSAGQLLFGATGSFPLTAKIESVYDASASFGRSAKLIISGANGAGTLTERVAIDVNGRVGIGSTGPDYNLQVAGTNPTIAINATNASASSVSTLLYRNVDGNGNTRNVASIEGESTSNGGYGALAFHTAFNNSLNERFRCDADGRLLVGTSTFSGNAGIQINPNNGNCLQSIDHITGTASGESYLFFNYNGSAIGNITQNGTTAVAYNTTSDYRLKENVTAVTDGITRLQQLKPSRFNFIADPDRTVDGFIAHEAQAVVPECVTGTKDEVDEDGNPVYQGIDQSKLVPLLTAALQEAIAKIETLEARLTAAGIE